MDGAVSGLRTTSGDYNAFMGYQSGQFNVTGSQNVFLGANSGPSNVVLGNLTNAIAIGYNAFVRNNNHMILGNNSIYVGIGLSEDVVQGGPQNKLEINTNLIDHLSNNPIIPGSIVGTTGASGLRFRDLKVGSTALTTNPHTIPSVLTVDLNGDVVLVEDQTNIGGTVLAENGLSFSGPNPLAVQLGQSIPAIGNPGRLLDNREIPFNAFNILFSGNDPLGTSRLCVGQNPSGLVEAKMFVHNEIEANGIYSEMNGNSVGLDMDMIARTGYRVKNAIHGFTYVDNATIGTAVGVLGEAKSTFGATGVLGYATGTGTSSIGVVGDSKGTGAFGFGGTFRAVGAATSENFGINADAGGAPVNYAVYASVATAGPQVAGTPLGPNYAGYFNGDVYISGTYGPSDRNLKENIDSISSALVIINQLKPKTFNYKHSSYPSMNLPSGLQYGLIAQEVETILPALVTNNTHPAKLDSIGNVLIPQVTFKGLEYQQLIPFLIKGMQEQQSTIDSMRTMMSQMATMMNSCCQNNSTRTQTTANKSTVIDVELSDKDIIVLNQNVPNPFAEQTTITYNVPEKAGFAQIIFNDLKGQIIKVIDIKTKGNGQLNVFANDLSTGIYTYSLYVDGKLIATKKMVKTD